MSDRAVVLGVVAVALAACSSPRESGDRSSAPPAAAPQQPAVPPKPAADHRAGADEAAVLAHALTADGEVPASLRRVPPKVAVPALPPIGRVPPSWRAAASQALAGAWLVHEPGDRLVAYDFAGDGIRSWDGVDEHAFTLVIDEPCAITLDVGGHGGNVFAFAFHDGAAVFGMGEAGMIRGGEAIACDGGLVFRLDRTGACHATLTMRPARCALHTDAHGTTFTYEQEPFDKTTLGADGDVLWTDQLAHEHAVPVVDYEAAMAVVNDTPAAIAIRAGGHLGDTATVASAVATVATDRALIGTILDVSGVVLDAGDSVFDTGSGSMNRSHTFYLDLIPPISPVVLAPSISCITSSSPVDQVQVGHVVHVRGRIEELRATGVLGVRPCTLVP